MLDNSCAFTGHRPHKFPWRYNEADERCSALKAALREQIVALVEAGITTFYSGGADGVDCWLSKMGSAVVVLRRRYGMSGSWAGESSFSTPLPLKLTGNETHET